MVAKNSHELEVLKTYKLFIDGNFPRTESGRYYSIRKRNGELIANVCQASRKDFRNAVVAARNAQRGWADRTAYNRSQIIYRIAEMLQQRQDSFIQEMMALGYTNKKAIDEISGAINYLIHYAGWCDKYTQLGSSVNPVASSHFNFSVPEPMGVIASFASNESAVIGLLEAIVPAICGGNSVVVLASEKFPTSSITFAEVMATSDVPKGVVNVLTGKRRELLSHFSSHMDVNAIQVWDADPTSAFEMDNNSTENLKRVRYYKSAKSPSLSPRKIMDLQEIKTTWHPIENISGSGGSY